MSARPNLNPSLLAHLSATVFAGEFDETSPVSSAARHVAAAAARLALSFLFSFDYLEDATWSAVKRLLVPDSFWALCLVLIGWCIATVIGGPIGYAVNAVLLVLGIRELWDRLTEIGGSLKDWFLTAYRAKTWDEIEAAAAHCANLLSVGGVTILELVVTHRMFKLAEARLRERFPTPEWLKTQWEESVRRREKRSETPPKREEPKRRAEPSEASSTEPAKKPDPVERVKQGAEVVRKGAERLAPGLKGMGAKDAADALPAEAVVAGVVLAMAAAGTVVWAVSSSGRKR